MDTLLEVFRYRSISSGLWPACYPIFSLCYFCLWGPQGKTFEELKESIQRKFFSLFQDRVCVCVCVCVCVSEWVSEWERENFLQMCLDYVQNRGEHFWHVL